MAGGGRKCKCCYKLFRPDPRNRNHLAGELSDAAKAAKRRSCVVIACAAENAIYQAASAVMVYARQRLRVPAPRVRDPDPADIDQLGTRVDDLMSYRYQPSLSQSLKPRYASALSCLSMSNSSARRAFPGVAKATRYVSMNRPLVVLLLILAKLEEKYYDTLRVLRINNLR
jgi:hypothetical protein